MANDIEGLTSNETVSEPCRAATLRNELGAGSKHGETETAVKNDNSFSTMAHMKNEIQATENGAVPNGCVHRHAIDCGNGGFHASNEEICYSSSTDHGIFSGGSDCDSHDVINLSEKTSGTAGVDSQKSSTKMFKNENVTSEEAIVTDQEFANETTNDDKENNDTKIVTDVLACAKISDDLPEVPLDTLNDEKLRVLGEDTLAVIVARDECNSGIEYVMYESEKQMPEIMSLITKDLSEPYSIYTYRYFIHNWPNLCFLALHQDKCVGAIVCKLDTHKKVIKRGYIAMLAVAQDYRKRGIGSHLVIRAIKGMVADGCDEVVLETEITNKAALHLYENLGFVRDKRLFRYYLNGVDALRLKLWLK